MRAGEAFVWGVVCGVAMALVSLWNFHLPGFAP
jgi:hypothetical protein